MWSILKRYQEPFVVLLLVAFPVVKFLRSGQRPSPPSVTERLVLGIASPIQSALDGAIDRVHHAGSHYVMLWGVQEANERLFAENAELKTRLRQASELSAENQRLKTLLGYADKTPEREILAKVIGVNPVANMLSVRVNRGSGEQIKVHMPVLTSEGVVGQIERVVEGWSDVRLLTDRNSRVAVQTHRGRVRGTAAGAGDNKSLQLQNILNSEDVKAGDVVITSGTDGIFPKGLLVGTVTRAEKRSNGMFLDATIAPVVRMAYLEELLILPAVLEEATAEASEP